MASTTRILIIVPALNESGSIQRVIADIRQYVPTADVVVINDGSTDNTSELARQAGAVVLDMPYNVGIGAAVQTGFLYAAQHDYDIAVQTDGDGQHPPSELPPLIAQLLRGNADVVIGSRFLEDRGYQQTLSRRVGGWILARILSASTRSRITDPTSGFRASSKRAIALCSKLYPHDYPEPEAIIILHRAGLTIQEIPVTMKQRDSGRSSITFFRSGYYMVKVILAILINLLRSQRV
jgi:glycosyltransferase involved in cell wall biosynthesis